MGLEADGKLVWSYKEAMVPAELPKSLLVIGSGAIGIEFASFYRTMGAEVTVCEVVDRILPVEDEEVSAFAERAFALQPLFDSLATAFAAVAQRRGVELVVVPTRAFVETDPAFLRRILQNLLSNALRQVRGTAQWVRDELPLPNGRTLRAGAIASGGNGFLDANGDGKITRPWNIWPGKGSTVNCTGIPDVTTPANFSCTPVVSLSGSIWTMVITGVPSLMYSPGWTSCWAMAPEIGARMDAAPPIRAPCICAFTNFCVPVLHLRHVLKHVEQQENQRDYRTWLSIPLPRCPPFSEVHLHIPVGT